jgi:hypothetical protein
MIQIPLYRSKKLLLAFEWGVILADVAKKQGVELTPEIIARAEEIILKEFKTKNASQLAGEMEIILLSIFETNLSV